MVAYSDSIIEAVRKYIEELKKNDIPVQKVILFGSCVKGTSKDESDIDIAILSDAFTDDRFEERRRIVPLRRKIDSRIEPIPINTKSFAEGGNLIDEIKRTGIIVDV